MQHVSLPSRSRRLFEGVVDVHGWPLRWDCLEGAKVSRIRGGGLRLWCLLSREFLFLLRGKPSEAGVAIVLSQSVEEETITVDRDRRETVKGVAFPILEIGLGWSGEQQSNEDGSLPPTTAQRLALVLGHTALHLESYEGKELFFVAQQAQLRLGGGELYEDDDDDD